jgi:hypothetical protein
VRADAWSRWGAVAASRRHVVTVVVVLMIVVNLCCSFQVTTELLAVPLAFFLHYGRLLHRRVWLRSPEIKEADTKKQRARQQSTICE